MLFFRYQILWYVFLTALVLATQNVLSRKSKCDKKCIDILREAQKKIRLQNPEWLYTLVIVRQDTFAEKELT